MAPFEERQLVSAIAHAKRWHGEESAALVAELNSRRVARELAAGPKMTKAQAKRITDAIPLHKKSNETV